MHDCASDLVDGTGNKSGNILAYKALNNEVGPCRLPAAPGRPWVRKAPSAGLAATAATTPTPGPLTCKVSPQKSQFVPKRAPSHVHKALEAASQQICI